MMGYVSLVIAVIGFARQLLSYIASSKDKKMPTRDKVEALIKFKLAIKKAKDEGNTDDLEKIFTLLINK